MTINVDVIGQKLKIVSNTKNLVSGSQNFVRFFFNLDSDWDGLTVFAQFQQNGTAYNQYLDNESSVYLPAEITEGIVDLSLKGTGGTTIATVNYLTFNVDKNIILSNVQSTEISTSLYEQLVNRVSALTSSPPGSGGDTGTELRDIRNGKGQTYSTAGDAVRAAVQGVSSYLSATNFAASPILADFNNLPNNIIRSCGVYVIPQSSSEADDIPAGKIKIANAPVTGQMTGLIVTLGRRTDRIAGDTQIFIPWHGGTIKYRQYNSVSVEQSQTYAWSDWVTGNEDLPQYRSNINNTAASYNNLLSNYTKEGTFFALAANWNDIPARDNNTDSSHFANNDSYVVTNKQYSNYILQTAVGIASGAIYNRVIHKTNNTVFRDWYCVNLDAKPMNILAVGDSICWGGRNNHKGFVGDIGLPYQNIGVVGATLSNKVTSVTNIPNKLVEFYNSHSQAVNANNDGWAPDVIIANGGVNDYFYSAPLGNVPTAPAITDAEANALDRSTVMGGLQYLLYKMISCYPSAQRFFLISHKTYGAKSSADSTPVYWVSTACAAGYTQQDLHDAIVACCNVYSVKVIDVYNDSMIDSIFSQYRSATPYSSDHSITNTEYVDSDGVHPLAKGYIEGYKPLILAALRGNTSGTVSRTHLSHNEILEVLTG